MVYSSIYRNVAHSSLSNYPSIVTMPDNYLKLIKSTWKRANVPCLLAYQHIKKEHVHLWTIWHAYSNLNQIWKITLRSNSHLYENKFLLQVWLCHLGRGDIPKQSSNCLGKQVWFRIRLFKSDSDYKVSLTF